MLDNKFKYIIKDDSLCFLKKRLFKEDIKIEIMFDEIKKVKFTPAIGLFRNRSYAYIYSKKNKILIGHSVVGSGTLKEYELLIFRLLKEVRNNKNIKYVKGSWLMRFCIIIIFPFYMAIFLPLLFFQITAPVMGFWLFRVFSMLNIVLIATIIFNCPKNFKDLKVEKLDPRLIMKYGPKILFNDAYKKIVGMKTGALSCS
ncbi:hypothetical protein [Desulfoluna sp.]|uniref:hypothetical protein n=1 Tax=Desulfoluna sp. TaxID=2045199 RepID=UPI002636ADA5|nr:hypothetical protein [Desulfoluna sp.]